MTTRAQTVLSALAVIATITVAACAGAAGPGGAEVEVEVDAGGGGGDPTAYVCLGREVPRTALGDPTPADRLGADAIAALAEAQAQPEEGADLGDLATWWVASESAESIVLLRPLATPEDLGAGDVRTHEVAAVEVIDATNVKGWLVTQLGTCALRLPGADTATVTLDPADPAGPDTTELALLVTEGTCNSGQDATGRVRIASLHETTTTVELAVAVTPRVGDQTCPANPPTPFTVRLESPLGGRDVVDASVYPPRTITAP